MQSILQSTLGFGPTPVEPEHLDGRVAVITGGALGIGFEVSRALAHAGCRVIMINRKEEQGDNAISTIRSETLSAQVEWRGCDLGSLEDVRDVFSKLRADLDRLDFLVCSAGINVNEPGRDADGIDRHFGVNYLGHFYAINQLYPLLRKTSKMPGVPAPRIVFEASEMHRTAPSVLHFGSLEEINNPNIGPTEAYGRTKLAMILLAKYGLAGKVIKENNDKIYAISVHPGAVNTAMQEQWKDAYPGITGKLLNWTMLTFGRDVKQGSYSALWALTSDKIVKENMNGWYFSDPDTPGKESAQASDPALGAALFGLSERIVREKLGPDALLDWSESYGESMQGESKSKLTSQPQQTEQASHLIPETRKQHQQQKEDIPTALDAKNAKATQSEHVMSFADAAKN